MADAPTQLIDALAEHYAVEREIGAGGMATVYVARDLKHGRRVAIKVLRSEFAQAVGAERFVREIEIAASLTHPHILPLHDSGERDGFLYYVMPFIEGESLRERITREGALPVPEAVRLIRQVIDALGAAHSQGVVHRDIKPENVLLTANHALVADFGIARALQEATGRNKLTTAGVALGTPQYMAPEQATADATMDHRADLFAVGAVAYEVLTGVPPFDGENTRAVFTALMTATPAAPHEIRAAVPKALSDLVLWCLEKDPSQRPQTAGELLDRLDAVVTPATGVAAATGILASRLGRKLVMSAAVLLLVGGSLGAWRWSAHRSLEVWARNEAIPEVLRLLGDNRIAEAAQLALEAESVVGEDPVLQPLWPRLSSPFRIVTDPPGARVIYRPYESEDPWQELGETPIEEERFPVGAYRFHIEAAGYEPIIKVRSLFPANQLTELGNAGFDYLTDASYAIDVQLSPEGSLPEGFIDVAGGLYGTTPVIGFGTLQPLMIPPYKIQRTEVTVGAYQEFVDGDGYDDESNWSGPFVLEGQTLSWEDARARFLDATGRLAPAEWSLGRPPQDHETLPVGGVSWFEADAYCRWKGWSLPTLYHWARAALPSSDVWIPFNPLLARASNFDRNGPVPVASLDAIGISGAHDLGGNVREWVTTASGTGRYLVGGGWSDPIYALHDAFASSPWRREPVNGFRCAIFPDGQAPEHLTDPLEAPQQDFSRDLEPLPQAVFDTRQSFYAYDRDAPLGATVDSTRELSWGAREEWVTINTAYGERMPIRLHFPIDGNHPLEAVVFFGGGNVIRSGVMEDPQPPLDALVRSGRVLVEPAYDGTFQRNVGRTMQRIAGEGQRELLGNWIKDLGRTLDYLKERQDVDHTRVSYLGISLGSWLAIELLPFENRFRTAVIYSGGFGRMEDQASINDRSRLAATMTLPILMLGGRNDFNSPIRPQQEAFFRAFGTPEADKFFRVYESGHWPLPMNDVLRETVNFLDRYAGPR